MMAAQRETERRPWSTRTFLLCSATTLILCVLSMVYSKFAIERNKPWTVLASSLAHLDLPSQPEHTETVSIQLNPKDAPLSSNVSHASTNTSTDLLAHKTVLLVTYYRGGSTFLGSAFGVNPDVFYYFEPLHSMERIYSTTSALNGKTDVNFKIMENGSLGSLPDSKVHQRSNILHNALTCHLAQMDLKVLSDIFFVTAQTMPKFKNYTKCLRMEKQHGRPDRHKRCAKSYLQPACSACRTRVIKTIRYPMYMVPNLLRHIPDLKVVHYVRDPRGTMSSRIKIHGFRDNILSIQSKLLCQQMVHNQNVFKHLSKEYPAENFIFLKYEDLALDANKTAHKIYNLLHEPFPLSKLPTWIERHTKAKKRDWNYGTVRDSLKTVYKWKTSLGQNEKKRIKDACGEALTMFGYE